MGQAAPKSPRIVHLTWGRIEVEGFSPFKDAKKGIEAEILQTEAAVKRFNELRENLPVGGLFHSTC
jgi:hypothetical protein